MIKRLLFLTLLIILVVKTNAQYYLTGVEPFSTTWRQIKTPNFRVIFPSEAEQIAVRYANLLSLTDTITPKSLNAKQKFFNVVVHNHSVLSNGFVVWAPKRMEIVSQSPSSTYAQPWLTQLALHETRHVSQLYKLYGGIVKPASYLFGEQAVGLMVGFVPTWFLEGDAVAFETATSNSGRGRQADFYQYYRTHYLTRSKRFKYDKWLMGSYRDNIPNHYNFGYQLVSYAKIKYGDTVWANTLEYVSRNPYTIFPFYFGLKQQTELSRKELFEKTFNHLDSLWTRDQKLNRLDKVTSMVKECREYTDYRYPFLKSDSLLVVYKTSLSRIPQFVLVDLNCNKEKVLFCPGYLTSRPSYYKEMIFWTEYLPHIRWEYKSYSVIKWFDARRGIAKTVSDRGMYLSPVYNPYDGLLYAISEKEDGQYSIDAFNFAGNKVKSIPLPQYYQPFELIISDTQNSLFVAVVSDKGKSIVRVNDEGRFDSVFGSTYLDIHSISSYGNLILFSTSYGYKTDLFALNVKTKEIKKITSSEFGCTDPSYYPKTNRIIFSNFTEKGYTIADSPLDTMGSNIIPQDLNNDWMSRRLSTSEKFNIDSTEIPNNSFKIEKFKGIKTLVNIHSWAPFFYDPDKLTNGEVEIKPGVTILSQNLTGSSVLTAGYGYDSTHLVHINYQYFGLFPVISYTFDLSGSSPLRYIEKTKAPTITEKRKESTVSFYLPLRLSSNRFTTLLYPIVQLISSNDYYLSVSDSLYHKGFHRFNYRLYFSVLQKQALKDVRPRLGFVANLEMENAPFNKNNFGSITAGTFNLYLPGVGINHSILVTANLQNQKLKRYYYSNKIISPRGYSEFYSETFESISLEYLFPLAYPDFSIGSLAYIKRFSVNSFFDYGKNSYPTRYGEQSYKMRSFGFEVFTDFNLFRTRYPIRLKLQQGWAGSNLLPFNSFSIFVDFYGQ